MEATTVASSVSTSPRNSSPATGANVAQNREQDFQSSHSTPASRPAGDTADDVSVVRSDIPHAHAASSHSSTPAAAQVAATALRHSPAGSVPSTESSTPMLRAQMSTAPLPAMGYGAQQPGYFPVAGMHQGHHGQPFMNVASPVVPSIPTSIPPAVTSPFYAGSPLQAPAPMNVPAMATRRIASPVGSTSNQDAKFQRDLYMLSEALQRASPEAVRECVRMNWMKCVLGTDFHTSFLMNAITHHASGSALRRSVRDFGQNMTRECINEISSHLRRQDIDAIAPAILGKCSEQFLDWALERRLQTIDARSLINALARAERLGYNLHDILEDKSEKIGQNQHNRGAPVAPPPATRLRCHLCRREFKHTKHYDYHMTKRLCVLAAKYDGQGHRFICEECGAVFSTKAGLQYHITHAVCGPRLTPIVIESRSPTPIIHRPKAQPGRPPNPAPQARPVSQGAHSVSSSDVVMVDSPDANEDTSHLNPSQKARYVAELQQIEVSHAAQCKEAEELDDPIKQQILLDSLQNTFNTTKDLLRRKFGIKTDEETARSGNKHARESSGETSGGKRQRTDESSKHSAQSSNTLATGDSPTSRQKGAAADNDPITPSGRPRKGLAVPVSARRDPTGSAMKPVVLDDSSSDTDSDGDGEIPAVLPKKNT